jgi:acetyl-CoA carboxylase biotin carboxyl carrier protein
MSSKRKPTEPRRTPPAGIDVDSIRALADVVEAYGLSELELRLEGGAQLILRRGPTVPPAAVASPSAHLAHAPSHVAHPPHAAPPPPALPPLAPGMAPPVHAVPAATGQHPAAVGASVGPLPTLPLAPVPAATSMPASAAESVPAQNGQYLYVSSPFVGTFYRAPSPEAPVFVEVGQHVKKGQVVCIVEAMKLMNEIEAEVEGTLVACLVENATPVEYGQALFKISP